MPPIPRPDSQTPRLVLYQQTHHNPDGTPVSLLPLLTQNTGLTHLYIAAFHINDAPGNITLNDNAPSDPKFSQLWREVKQLQDAGVRVMAMLGGAAKGTYARLAGDEDSFNAYYTPLAATLRRHGLQGVDLDIEEPFAATALARLITRLRADLGGRAAFPITLAPVAPALLPFRPWLAALYRRLLTTPAAQLAALPPVVAALLRPGVLRSGPHLSGFSHFDLEAGPLREEIGWYNVQFYNGWGDAARVDFYEAMLAAGWRPERIVLGVLTSPRHGSGFVGLEKLVPVIQTLMDKHAGFGGVMGWEFWGAGIGEGERRREDWMWVKDVRRALGPVADTESSHTRSAKPPPAPVAAVSDALQQASLANPSTEQRPPAEAEDQSPEGEGFPEQHIRHLVELGFERPEAIAALEAMGGDVDAAAGLLFGDG